MEDPGDCQYPSDVSAGLDLGRKVATLVIERGKADGSDVKWTGSVPAGAGKWNSTNPILPQMAIWKTWVLSSPSEFRSPAPPAYNSPEKAAELAEIKNSRALPRPTRPRISESTRSAVCAPINIGAGRSAD